MNTSKRKEVGAATKTKASIIGRYVLVALLGAALTVITNRGAQSQAYFRCPAPGTKVIYTDGRVRVYQLAREGRCEFIDSDGVRYFGFPDFSSVPATDRNEGRWAGKGLEALWPLKTGYSARFSVSLMPENLAYTEMFTVTKEDEVLVADRWYRTFVIVSREFDKGYDKETIWWYSPDAGLVVKSATKCNMGSRCVVSDWEVTSIAPSNSAPSGSTQ